MSRGAVGTPILVKPSNNVYTALLGIATLAALAATIAVFVKAGQLDLNFFAV